jgi:hypothetical protein
VGVWCLQVGREPTVGWHRLEGEVGSHGRRCCGGSVHAGVGVELLR